MTEMMEGLAKLSDGQEKAAKAETLASALKDIATSMSTKRSQDEFVKVNDPNKRMKDMENKINRHRHICIRPEALPHDHRSYTIGMNDCRDSTQEDDCCINDLTKWIPY